MTQPLADRDITPDFGLFLPRPWLTFDPGRVLRDAPVHRTPGDALVYIRGRITSAGQKPIQLGYWRRVVLNTGTAAVASEQVAFPD